MNVFTKFLASQVSGYLLIVVVAGVLASGGVVWHWVSDYKDLKISAAYCEGQLSTQKVLKSIQNRASDIVKAEANTVVKEIEVLREQAKEQMKNRGLTEEENHLWSEKIEA